MEISKKCIDYINKIKATDEFWKVNYYLHSIKKPLHGGVFNMQYPNYFLNYDIKSVLIRLFLPNFKLPSIIMNAAKYFANQFNQIEIDIEEIILFCFSYETPLMKEPDNYAFAVNWQIITKRTDCPSQMDTIVYQSIHGKYKFKENFNYDVERLFAFFICKIATMEDYIKSIDNLITKEQLLNNRNKYGLTNITSATFEREGFTFNNIFYLYNIFFNTSIGKTGKYPETIGIMKKNTAPIQIWMRCDTNIAVKQCDKVSIATTDMQKWRGVTLNFGEIDNLLSKGKQIIVHYDEKTYNKVLITITRNDDSQNECTYNICVEQLWNPDFVKDIVLLNFIHGKYDSNKKAFTHIDYSINQYTKEKYSYKFNDSPLDTGISIDAYADQHYKVWCIESDNIIENLWIELVCATLDDPFRNIFMETLGGQYRI